MRDETDETLDIVWHPDCFLHDAGEGCYEYEPNPLIEVNEPHPETPERLINVKSVLERGALRSRFNWFQGGHATIDEIALFHEKRYIDFILDAEKNGPTRVDGAGTVVADGTVKAVLAAAGCSLQALQRVLASDCQRAYALVRPPGHHAQPTMADGNCIFNNVGICCHHALASGIGKVAVIDWDVHHGNGTQEGFYDRNDVLTISMHMPLGAWSEFHPQTGDVDEIGRGEGAGYNLNIPLPYGSGDRAYEAAMEELVAPRIASYQPDLLIIACGQDANQFDPNGRNLLSMRGFRRLGGIARRLADESCSGRLLMLQEGGYALTYTGFCMYAIMEGILGVEDPMDDPLAYDESIEKPQASFAAIREIRRQWEQRVAACESGVSLSTGGHL